MSGRNLDSNFEAAMQAAHVDGFVMVDMILDSGPLYLCGLPFSFAWAGKTYIGVGGLGSVAQILETDREVAGLTFTLSGVPEDKIALVHQEDVQGRAVQVRMAVLDGTTVYVDENVWQGLLDVMTIDDSGPKATINVTAEHTLNAWEEPNVLLYSHEDQQRVAPGDKFFEFAAEMSNATIVWPGKEFDQV